MSDVNGETKDLSFLELIAITDDLRDGVEGLLQRAQAAVAGGATSIQVRLKDCTPRQIVDIAVIMGHALKVPIIVNDRADLAIAAGAAGVHLGPTDLPVKAVRRFVPHAFVIGASFGGESEFRNAALADYVGIGPVAATVSKTDAGTPIGAAGFRTLAARIALPAVAVGGIDALRAADLASAGAKGVAVMSAIFGAKDPEKAAAEILAAFRRGAPPK